MKIVILSLLIVSGILSGCVVEPAYRGNYHGGYGYRDRDGVPNRYDRDRDGIRNSQDRFPDNPRRY